MIAKAERAARVIAKVVETENGLDHETTAKAIEKARGRAKVIAKAERVARVIAKVVETETGLDHETTAKAIEKARGRAKGRAKGSSRSRPLSTPISGCIRRTTRTARC